jgi:serine/threonine-protein kinase
MFRNMGEDSSGLGGTTVPLQRTAVAPAAAPAGAERIGGRYDLLGLLGTGGMGRVYRVRDVELGEVVALKFVRRDLLDAPGMLERFRQEVRLARRVTHVNVARTYDIGEHQGERFLTMEYVDGEPLGRWLEQQGPLPPRRAIEIALDLCAALEAAHAADVVHQDLKPDNVLLARSGRVVITDFGIASALADAPASAEPVGTPAYLAPEQLQGSTQVDTRADLYAVGGILYELLTAARPFATDGTPATLLARATAPAPDPRARNADVPDALAAIVLRCLAPRREDRFPSAARLASALREALAGLSTPPAPPRRSTAHAIAPAPSPTDKTVAIVPFRNAGRDADETLAAAVTEELVDTLSTTNGVRVRPHDLVARRAAALRDPLELGRALEVQVVIEGSLARSGDFVRVDARALSVADGFQLWAKQFERPARDALAVSAEIVRAVAQALTVDLTAPARAAPTNPAAIEVYLRARQALRQNWKGNGDLARGAALFEEARALAPDDPSVLAGYAMARARLLVYGGRRQASERELARGAAERVIAIAPHLGESWLALACVRWTESDVERTVEALRAALTRALGLAKAHDLLGHILLEIGHLEEAIFRFETTLELDPAELTARMEIARAHAYLGAWDACDALLGVPLEDRPGAVFRALTGAG